jgi:hypothetical protein
MFGGDEMDSATRVPIVSYMWASVVPSYHVRQ